MSLDEINYVTVIIFLYILIVISRCIHCCPSFYALDRWNAHVVNVAMRVLLVIAIICSIRLATTKVAHYEIGVLRHRSQAAFD